MDAENAVPTSKDELLTRMRDGRAEWDALIGQVPETALTEPLLDNGWLVKDLLAHVAAYEQWTAAQMRAAHEGREPTNMELYGVDELPVPPGGEWSEEFQNAAIYGHYRDTPLAEVRVLASRAYQDFLTAVEACSEEDLAETGAQAWVGDTTLLALIPGQSYGHYAQHLEAVRAIVGRGTG